MALLKNLVPCLALVMFVSCFSEAREFVLGGNDKQWQIPSSPDEYNKWAEKERFLIGDSIVMKYDSEIDSVLEVCQDDYQTCNRDRPIKSYHRRVTKITLDRSGPFYFISGAEGHCQKGQKVEINVLGAHHHHHHRHRDHSDAPPVPSPMDDHGQAPAPATTKNGGHGLRARGFVRGTVMVASFVGGLFLF